MRPFLLCLFFISLMMTQWSEAQAQNKKKQKHQNQQTIDISKDHYSGKYQGDDGGKKLIKRRGSFTGTITDYRQNIIKSAQIKLREIGYGVLLEDGEPSYYHTYNKARFWHILGNADGTFSLQNIPVGRYELFVEHAGYEPFTQIFKISGHRRVHIKLRSNDHPSQNEFFQLPEQEVVSTPLIKRFPQVNTANSMNGYAKNGNLWQKRNFSLRNQDHHTFDYYTNSGQYTSPLSSTHQLITIPQNSELIISRSGSSLANGESGGGAQITMKEEKLNSEHVQLYTRAGLRNSYQVQFNLQNIIFPDNNCSDFEFDYRTNSGYVDRSGEQRLSAKIKNKWSKSNNFFMSEVSYLNQQEKAHWYGVPLDSLEDNRQYNPLGIYTNKDLVSVFYDDENVVHNVGKVWISHQTNVNKKIQLQNQLGLKYHNQQLTQMIDTSLFQLIPYAPSSLLDEKYVTNINQHGSIRYLKTKITYDTHVHKILGMVNFYRNDQWLNGQYRENKDSMMLEFYNIRNIQQHADICGEYRMTPIDRMVASATLKYSLWNTQSEGTLPSGEGMNYNKFNHLINSSVSVYYTLSQFQSFSATWSMRQNTPDLPSIMRNELILADRSQNLNIGYELSMRHFEIKTNMYGIFTKNELTPSNGNNNIGERLYENVEQSNRIGLEIQGKYQHTGRWNIEGNLCLSRNRAKHYTLHAIDVNNSEIQNLTFENTQLALSPSILTNVTLNYHIAKGFRTSVNLSYIGASQLDHTESVATKIDGYITGDLYLEYRLPLKTQNEAPKKSKFARAIQNTTNSLSDFRIVARINNITGSAYEASGWSNSYIESGAVKNIAAVHPQARVYADLGVYLTF